MGEPQLPSDEVMRVMSKMAIEQATEYFAKMAVTLAGEMRTAGHGAMITGPDALEAFARAIRSNNERHYERPDKG